MCVYINLCVCIYIYMYGKTVYVTAYSDYAERERPKKRRDNVL